MEGLPWWLPNALYYKKGVTTSSQVLLEGLRYLSVRAKYVKEQELMTVSEHNATLALLSDILRKLPNVSVLEIALCNLRIGGRELRDYQTMNDTGCELRYRSNPFLRVLGAAVQVAGLELRSPQIGDIMKTLPGMRPSSFTELERESIGNALDSFCHGEVFTNPSPWPNLHSEFRLSIDGIAMAPRESLDGLGSSISRDFLRHGINIEKLVIHLPKSGITHEELVPHLKALRNLKHVEIWDLVFMDSMTIEDSDDESDPIKAFYRPMQQSLNTVFLRYYPRPGDNVNQLKGLRDLEFPCFEGFRVVAARSDDPAIDLVDWLRNPDVMFPIDYDEEESDN